MTTNSRTRNRSVRYCSPSCEFFRCSKRALGPKKQVRGRPRITCKFVEGDLCTASKCTYSFCTKRKMDPDGTCGLRDRSNAPKKDEIEIEKKYEKELIEKDKTDNRYQSMMKNKYRKKLKGK